MSISCGFDTRFGYSNVIDQYPLSGGHFGCHAPVTFAIDYLKAPTEVVKDV